MVAKVGHDTFGADMIDNFKAVGVDVTHVTTTKGTPGSLFSPPRAATAGRPLRTQHDHPSPPFTPSLFRQFCSFMSETRMMMQNVAQSPPCC